MNDVHSMILYPKLLIFPSWPIAFREVWKLFIILLYCDVLVMENPFKVNEYRAR